MTIAWVIGAGGLLGSALTRVLTRQRVTLFHPNEAFCWGDAVQLDAQIMGAVEAFAAVADNALRWEIYWAAGIGTMSSAEAHLEPETSALRTLLNAVASHRQLKTKPGSLAFASSAGAVYAGSVSDVITESTPVAPTTAYARVKLRQEDCIQKFVAKNENMIAVIARISTLYGPGQASGKQQGLLAHIARSVLRNQPIQIYVPYDTIRDYINADDAANAIVATLSMGPSECRLVIKIVASEVPATIAEIVSIFKRVARRTPRIVTSASRLSTLYTRRVQFKSLTASIFQHGPRTSLTVGISQLMSAERVQYTQLRGPSD